MPAIEETEPEFQSAVIDYAQLMGWRVAHFRAARTERGWRTPVAADGAGFPDLVLVRGGRLIFAELKARRGALRSGQLEWIEALGEVARSAGRVSMYIWRPDDWPAIEEVLKR